MTRASSKTSLCTRPETVCSRCCMAHTQSEHEKALKRADRERRRADDDWLKKERERRRKRDKERLRKERTYRRARALLRDAGGCTKKCERQRQRERTVEGY